MAMTAAGYLSQLQALLPPGTAWPREATATVTRILTALSAEFALIDGRSEALLDEADPRTANELLLDYERLLCIVPPVGASIAARQTAVLGRLLTGGDIKKPALGALAASMGYTIRIDDYTESQADWLCAGDEMLDEPWGYFTAGISMAGDYLAQEQTILPWCWEVIVTAVPDLVPTPDLETLLNDLKPAHIKLNFTYL